MAHLWTILVPEAYRVKGKDLFSISLFQAMPEFSSFYIEFEEALGDANMGGGNGQIDLLSHQFDWACG